MIVLQHPPAYFLFDFCFVSYMMGSSPWGESFKHFLLFTSTGKSLMYGLNLQPEI